VRAARLHPGVSVEVTVPASSANLGPGFDSVGCALGLWDTCRATVTNEPGLVVVVRGEGAGAVPVDEHHLVYRSACSAWAEVGVAPPSGLRLDCDNGVPHGRGLGSSATAIVTGVVAAHALLAVSTSRTSAPPGDPTAAGGVAVPLDLAAVCRIATRLEGHPDNASASVYGGVTLSWCERPEGPATSIRLPVHPEVEPVVLVPAAQLSTARARAILPAGVRLADAANNAARAALLAHALGNEPDLLLAATRDWLHQEARRPSYPATMAVVDDLRGVGLAAAVSGAGPSVLVLGRRGRLDEVEARVPADWRIIRPGVPDTGASVRTADTVRDLDTGGRAGGGGARGSLGGGGSA
jgi:homoserine kinase